MYLAKVHYKNKDAVKILTKAIKEILESYDETIFVCIGSNAVIFDSLGPLVGEMVEYCNSNIVIYGNLDDRIDGTNIPKKFKKIKSYHNNKNIIAIDACTSNTHPIGTILIKKGTIKPGAGVGKKLEEIGNYCICGITSLQIGSFDRCLYDTGLDFIKDLSEVISLSILLAYDKTK